MSDSDAALVARVVADDDRGAFELLVRRHQSAVRNFLRRLARNDVERANDLAQETFIKMHAGLHSYRGAARLSTWLFRIAYHTFLNDERGRRTNVEFSEDEHAGAEDTAAATATTLDVDSALERLPVRQRAVFDLHYKKGMTHSEVADALELPIGTVKSDLKRGHEKLKGWLAEGVSQ
ncbi:MAG TPA: sigma-70 family RNA polymerase sigma factor [Gammaproteobacteria bacterium]|nr:sigma-70 family RNA polymerase sigma factor [Gammaproteobacteria bacterium]